MKHPIRPHSLSQDLHIPGHMTAMAIAPKFFLALMAAGASAWLYAFLSPVLQTQRDPSPNPPSVPTGVSHHHDPPRAPPLVTPPPHYVRTVSYICATYEDYLHWSHNFYTPSFYSIIGIEDPGESETFESVQGRVLTAWWHLQETMEEAQGLHDGSRNHNTNREENHDEESSFSFSTGPDKAAKKPWGESLTKAMVWSQIVHVLLDERARKLYDDVFMALIRDGKQDLATQCQWEA